MGFLENDLESIIYNAPQGKLIEKGLDGFKYSKVLRQVHLGEYGRADLVGIKLHKFGKGYYKKHITVDVFELKQDEINAATLMQCIGYVKGVSMFIREHYNEYFSHVEINPILIGRTIENRSNLIFMPDYYYGLRVYTYKYDVDGLSFKKIENYHKAGNTFSEKIINTPRAIIRDLISNQEDFSDKMKKN